MSLHITEFPHEITSEQMDAAIAALGFGWRKCAWLEMTPTNLRARIVATDLMGRIVGHVEIDVPCRPGAER